MDNTTILCPRCIGAGHYNGATCYHCNGTKRIPIPDISDEDSQTVLAICEALCPALTKEIFTDSTIQKIGTDCWNFDGTALEHAVLDALQCVLLGLASYDMNMTMDAFTLVGDDPQRIMKDTHHNPARGPKLPARTGRCTRKLEYVSLASGGYYKTKQF